MKRVLLLCLASSLVASAATAQMVYTPTDQERVVSAGATLNGPSDSVGDFDDDDAPNFDPWNATVSVGGGATDGTTAAVAQQNSDFAIEGINIAAQTSGELDIFDDTTTVGSAFAESRFSCTFTLDEATDYALIGGLDATVSASGTIMLEGDGGWR